MKISSQIHHCSRCKRCVYKMDHHCPWTDNCVGYKNIKAFMLFLFYASLLCIYGVTDIYLMAFKHNLRYIQFSKLLPMSMAFVNPEMLKLAEVALNNKMNPDNQKEVPQVSYNGLF